MTLNKPLRAKFKHISIGKPNLYVLSTKVGQSKRVGLFFYAQHHSGFPKAFGPWSGLIKAKKIIL